MKIAYEDEFVRLYCGDCRSLFNGTLGDFDHMMTDPPYDDETHEGARSDFRPGYRVAFSALDASDLGYVSTRIVRRWSLAFCSLEMLGDYRVSVGDRWVRSGIWDRVGGAPQFTGDRPAQPAEGIAIWHSLGKKRWNGGGKAAKWRHPIVRGEERVHETQKPVSLMRELILDFTDEGEVIYDPYAGSGTTGVAAKQCGRRAVLVEVDPERCELAAERLQATDVDARLLVGSARTKARQGAFDMKE